MKATLTLRSVIVAVVATSGLVVGGAQRASGDDSVLASATITNPQDGETVYGDITVQAQATGQDVDPPHRIQFFVDHDKRPSATVNCFTNLADPSYYCGAQWLWHTHGLVGRHSVSAKVVLLDGRTSARSQPAHVIVVAETHLVVDRHQSTLVGRKMILAGRVITRSKGHPGARHMPVTLHVTTPFRAKDIHLHTNARGYYRTKIPATGNTVITVSTSDTRKYIGRTAGKTYFQYVRGRPHCWLSKRHARVKQFVILRCHLKHLPGNSKFEVQNRIHGKWRRAAKFKTDRDNGSKLYVRLFKPGTVIMREVFARSGVWDQSTSNAVRLHVS